MTGPIFDTHAHYSARAFDADRYPLLGSLPGKGVVMAASSASRFLLVRMVAAISLLSLRWPPASPFRAPSW